MGMREDSSCQSSYTSIHIQQQGGLLRFSHWGSAVRHHLLHSIGHSCVTQTPWYRETWTTKKCVSGQETSASETGGELERVSWRGALRTDGTGVAPVPFQSICSAKSRSWVPLPSVLYSEPLCLTLGWSYVNFSHDPRVCACVHLQKFTYDLPPGYEMVQARMGGSLERLKIVWALLNDTAQGASLRYKDCKAELLRPLVSLAHPHWFMWSPWQVSPWSVASMPTMKYLEPGQSVPTAGQERMQTPPSGL